MTLKDIAEKAGVSMMTVSNVINGKHNRVSEKTIEKVNAIIKEYGYVPNLSARSLTNKTSNIIGVLITEYTNDNGDNYLENPYISTMIGTIERELRQNGYYTMVRTVYQQSDIVTILKNWNVDGIIFLHPDFQEYLESLYAQSGCPLAVFDGTIPLPDLINITSDDQKGLYLSTKYMINHGHSHIAFVADYEGNDILTRRFSGYLQALEESGIPFRPEYVFPFTPSYEGGIEAGKKIAGGRNEITAVVTTADICAIGVMEGARLSGYRIPIDLSVIGFDNLKLCQYTVPKLTSISQNIPLKAKTAVTLLLEQIRSGALSQSGHVQMDVEIVERQSVVSLF